MIIDGRGMTIDGASIVLAKGDKIYNAKLIRCDIDDIEATTPWMEKCEYYDCKIRSQWEAGLRLAAES